MIKTGRRIILCLLVLTLLSTSISANKIEVDYQSIFYSDVKSEDGIIYDTLFEYGIDLGDDPPTPYHRGVFNENGWITEAKGYEILNRLIPEGEQKLAVEGDNEPLKLEPFMIAFMEILKRYYGFDENSFHMPFINTEQKIDCGTVSTKSALLSKKLLAQILFSFLENTDEIEKINYTIPQPEGEAMADFALSFYGARYVYGGTGPNTFDCSGFVQYVMRAFGYAIPRTASAQFAYGRTLSLEELQPGDLVFFEYTYPCNSRITHVGIYIGNYQFIHAANSRVGVVINSLLEDDYYINKFAGGVRISTVVY